MFFRLSFVSLAALAFGILSVLSAPLDVEFSSRQIGNVQCNLDRLAIVTALAQTINDVNSLGAADSSDPSVTAAACEALNGLDNAKDGITTIADALLKGQKAPASARDQVGQGLDTAQTALNSIKSTNSSVTSALSKAKKDLNKAVSAGNGVVANCK